LQNRALKRNVEKVVASIAITVHRQQRRQRLDLSTSMLHHPIEHIACSDVGVPRVDQHQPKIMDVPSHCPDIRLQPHFSNLLGIHRACEIAPKSRQHVLWKISKRDGYRFPGDAAHNGVGRQLHKGRNVLPIAAI
jgi:hypothetical protein